MTEESCFQHYRMEIVLCGIILLSAFLNLWNIWTLGYTNTYYAAAVRSMLENPGVLFFNSFDAGGFVTVDKPPVGLWVQALSAILFGFSGWALVLPQALAGIASVALLYCIVSRPFGKPAGLVAAFALAVTPILVAVCRNETMDGLLIFVILLAVWAALEAAYRNSLPLLLSSVILVGIGFNIKMIQAFVVVPAVIAVYLLGARDLPIQKRLLHIALAIAVLAIVSLSWAVVVDSIPASERPYIGGSGDNTVMGLIINYNGIHRLESDDTARPGGAGMSSPGGGSAAAGLTAGAGGMPPGMPVPSNRSADLPDGTMMPAGGTGPGQAAMPPDDGRQGTGSSDRTDGRMAADAGGLPGSGAPGGRTGGGMDNTGSPGVLRLFGSGLFGQLTWLLPFALIGLLAWARRPGEWSLKGLADAGYFTAKGLVLLAMCLWLLPGILYFSFTTGFWHTYYLATITPPLAALAGIGAAGMYSRFREGGRAAGILIAAVLVTGLAQAAFLSTETPGWTVPPAILLAAGTIIISLILAFLVLTRRTGTGLVPVAAVAIAIGLLVVMPCIWSFSTMAAGGNVLPVAGLQAGRGSGSGPGGLPGGTGFSGAGSSDSGLARYLVSHKAGERWILAVSGSQEASGIILSTGEPVMALGGFTGSDQILSTSALADLVKDGEIRYFSVSSGMENRGGSSGNSAILSWVSSHCTAVPASEYGGTGSASSSVPGSVRDLTGTTQSSGSPPGIPGMNTPDGGLQGGRTLYDCRNATA